MMWALVAAIGLVAGVVSGLFGVGGAVVIIPALVLLAKVPHHTASGTSLAALLLPVGLLAAMEYYRRGTRVVPSLRVTPPAWCCGARRGQRRAVAHGVPAARAEHRASR